MSVAILQNLRSWLDTAGLLAGYEVKYNRWTDADVGGGADFVMFRFAGPGTANRIVQRYDIDLFVVAGPTYVPAQDRINEIAKYLNSIGQPPGVVRYSIPGNPTGPFQLENGRQVFQLAVVAYDSIDLPA